jgi:hypothetical protein
MSMDQDNGQRVLENVFYEKNTFVTWVLMKKPQAFVCHSYISVVRTHNLITEP